MDTQKRIRNLMEERANAANLGGGLQGVWNYPGTVFLGRERAKFADGRTTETFLQMEYPDR